ncbi:MAG TPA: class I SAM-dependent methyltransferase [Actinomadura sp.]|nr:class I SAM-dependent methyltransferase [Actinomadura sp.]
MGTGHGPGQDSRRQGFATAEVTGLICVRNIEMPGEPVADARRPAYVQVPGEPVFDVRRRRYLRDSANGASQEHAPPMAEVFDTIYRRNKWGSPETHSGAGSERGRVQWLQRSLEFLLARLGTRSLLDAACGDFNWLREVRLSGIDYVGADIVADMVRANRARYEAPGRRFVVLDVTRDALPPVDMIMCRDCLVHLSDADLAAALGNFARSGAAYLLTTDYVATEENLDIVNGWWRPVNLGRPPFDLPPALLQLPDADSDDLYPDKVLGLWRIADWP